jgi:hypothetical protein
MRVLEIVQMVMIVFWYTAMYNSTLELLEWKNGKWVWK